MLDIAIIGGGLSGLSLARHLTASKPHFALFESRDRFGGRIYSVPPASAAKTDETSLFRFDLGPSWIWPDSQPRIASFIAEQGIMAYRQWLNGHALYQPEREAQPQAYIDQTTYESARRIDGGAYRLIEVLLGNLPSERLHLRHQLRTVIDRGSHVELRFDVDGSSMTVTARQIVITIPPRLLAESVVFDPPLDERLSTVMKGTATWMAGHAKAVIRYSRAFWRDKGLSGAALANYRGAALAEIFDATSPDGNTAALSGFFALPAPLRMQYRDDLEALILEQLVRLFGSEAAQPEEILIKDWYAAPSTAAYSDEIPPNQHPHYGHPWLQLDHWNDKLYFGGTETAPQFGGYLEGALESAERVFNALLM